MRLWVHHVIYSAVLSGLLILNVPLFVRAQQPSFEASISIDASKRLHKVSPLLYGHFTEFMFEDIKGGMWAELLRNRGFEEIAPRPSVAHYWEPYPDNRNDPSVQFGGQAYGMNLSEQGYPTRFPNRAQVMVSSFMDPTGGGIYQGNIPLRAGISYRGSIWLRAMDAKRKDDKTTVAGPFPGRIRISLEEDTVGGKVYAQQDISEVSTEWRRYEFELPVDFTDRQARFTIQLIGRGAVWVDQVSLMPSDSKAGIRADVFEKILTLRPAFIRWPGGNVAQDYHWEWGIGRRDERPIWVNMSWSNDPEPADYGTNEYIALCQAVGAEPNLVVNVEGRGATIQEAAELLVAGKDLRKDSRQATAEEAANWVEYCNGPASSKYGALRARDGHPEPYQVKFWEIGNEVFGDWVRGYSNAATYAANARRYIQAMRVVDPTIQVIAVGDENMEWNKVVLREIGSQIDYLAVHHYYSNDETRLDKFNWFARPLWIERLYAQMDALIREIVPGHPVKLAVNEWNTSLPLPRQHSMESALFGARLLNVMLRRGDLIGMSAVSDLVNGWTGGIIQAGRHRVFTTPTYAVIRAYNAHLGTWRLASETRSASTFNPSDPKLGTEIPALDAVATTNADGSRIYLMVVNTDVTRSGRAEIEIAGTKGIVPQADVETINGPSLEAANTFETPERISARKSTIGNASNFFVYSFETHSVTLLTLHTKR